MSNPEILVFYCFFSFSDSCVIFPEELYSYGFDEKLLASVFHQVESGKEPIQWCFHGSRKFYIAIGKNLKEQGPCADNKHRFIECVVQSEPSQSDKLMIYGKRIAEIKVMRAQMKHCTEHIVHPGINDHFDILSLNQHCSKAICTMHLKLPGNSQHSLC